MKIPPPLDKAELLIKLVEINLWVIILEIVVEYYIEYTYSSNPNIAPP